MKKNPSILILVSLLLCGYLTAETRTFTSPDGRSLEGEVLAATPDMVTLKLVSGQTIAAPISKFSDADKTFIAEWRKANPPTIKYDFATTYSKEKMDSKVVRSGTETITAESWVCKMKIANRSGMTLENVKVDYDIYHTSLENGVVRKSRGTATIPNIKHLQELVLPTTPVKLHLRKLEGGYYYADGRRPREKETLEGMTITLTHEGKQVYRWNSPGAPAGGGTAEGTSGSLFNK